MIYTHLNTLADSLDISLERYQPIYSHLTGIINATLERTEFQKYGLYMYQCISASIQNLGEFSREPSSGGLGIADTREDALLACFGEALERYCLSWVDPAKIVRCTWKQLPEDKRVKGFDLYSEEQYASDQTFSSLHQGEFEWVQIHNLGNKKKSIYWPASLLYIPYEQGPRAAETSSTGTASHTDVQSAIQAGVLEIIERDAIVIHHVKKLTPNHVDLDTVTGHPQALLAQLREKYSVRIYQLHTDTGVPVYLSYIWQEKDPSGKFHFGIGGACALDSEDAIFKSLKECLFTFMYGYNMQQDRQADKDKIVHLYEHFLYYQDEKKFKDYLLKEGEQIPFQKTTVTFETLLASIMDAGHEVYFFDLTTPDISATGVHVIRSTIPGFIDLNASHKLNRNAARRFDTFVEYLGAESIPGFNQEPHPMP